MPARAMIAAEAWDLVEVERGRPSKNKVPKNGDIIGGRAIILGKMFGAGKTYVEQARFVLVNDPPDR